MLTGSNVDFNDPAMLIAVDSAFCPSLPRCNMGREASARHRLQAASEATFYRTIEYDTDSPPSAASLATTQAQLDDALSSGSLAAFAGSILLAPTTLNQISAVVSVTSDASDVDASAVTGALDDTPALAALLATSLGGLDTNDVLQTIQQTQPTEVEELHPSPPPSLRPPPSWPPQSPLGNVTAEALSADGESPQPSRSGTDWRWWPGGLLIIAALGLVLAILAYLYYRCCKWSRADSDAEDKYETDMDMMSAVATGAAASDPTEDEEGPNPLAPGLRTHDVIVDINSSMGTSMNWLQRQEMEGDLDGDSPLLNPDARPAPSSPYQPTSILLQADLASPYSPPSTSRSLSTRCTSFERTERLERARGSLSKGKSAETNAEMGVERSMEGAEEATRLNPRVDLSSAEETAIDVGVARQLVEGNESSPGATTVLW